MAAKKETRSTRTSKRKTATKRPSIIEEVPVTVDGMFLILDAPHLYECAMFTAIRTNPATAITPRAVRDAMGSVIVCSCGSVPRGPVSKHAIS